MVKYKDYYEILGVKREDPNGKIKSSYRKLARKYHPDLNKDKKKAEARFKEVQEAYDVLGDAKKRKQYDTLGANYQDGMDFQRPKSWTFRTEPQGGPGAGMGDFGGSGGLGGFSEFFESLFGGGAGGPGGPNMRARVPGSRRRPSPGGGGASPFGPRGAGSPKGADIETSLPVTLEEAFKGVMKKVRLHVNSTCSACQGSGVIAGSRCGACEGRGLAARPKSMEIKIPQGVKDGTRLRLAGQGEPAAGGRAAGDMFVKIKLQPHPIFTIRGHNVHVDLPVAPWEAVLGGEVDVPTLGGMLKMKLPPGSQTGVKMRLKRRGMPSSGGQKGDEIVHIKVMIPTEITDRERHLFRQLRDISHFRPRVKDRSRH